MLFTQRPVPTEDNAMTRKVALIHTSLVFIEKERMLFQIFDELLPDVHRINIIEDQMLSEVIKQGTITPSVIQRMCLFAIAAQTMGVDAIFSPCSSLGPAMDIARLLVSIPVVKIDEAMAEKAANEGKRIGVLATVPTTLQPTIDLIQASARAQQTRVETRAGLCQGAFDLLMNNQIEEHDSMVSREAREMSGWADMLVLAQCSMARLAPRLMSETGVPVLTSPRLAVERLKAVLDATSPACSP
jgi:Asp/Glu/hydantoin racemase